MSLQPSLADQIIDHYEISAFDQPAQVFLPQDCISKLITEDAVIKEFEEEDAGDTRFEFETTKDQKLVAFILKHAKKVFATAVVCDISGNELYKVMGKFKEGNFQDSSLPVKAGVLYELPCFSIKTWSNLKKLNFVSKQFVFLAPVFSRSEFKLELEPEHIFPFTWVSNEAKEGTFSQVFQVTIHDSHQDMLVDDKKPNVAIKEIKDRKSSNEQDMVNMEWEAEAKALEEVSDLNHENLIQRIAAITRGNKRYFMFQWADGGTLRDFWESVSNPTLDPTFVKEIVKQLRGLADALHELHNFNGGSYRHGDLKPENILRFKNNTCVGIWKIADMGLAKHHSVATNLRPPTNTRYGTVIYQPPEVKTDALRSSQGRSRLYDIWSIGCITLELIGWLLYGYNELKRFNNSIRDQLEESTAYYIFGEDAPGVATVHPRVREFMENMSQDPRCASGTALRDLLDIVRDRLLVVALPKYRLTMATLISQEGGNSVVEVTPPDIDPLAPSGTPQPPGPSRGTAQNFRERLDAIIAKGEANNSYWFTGKTQADLKGQHQVSSNDIRLAPEPKFRKSPQLEHNLVLGRRQSLPAGLSVPQTTPHRQPNDYDHPPLNNVWDFPVDNKFANSLFRDQKASAKPVSTLEAAKLCGRCMKLNFSAPLFRIKDTLLELKEQSASCEFCRMRWGLCKHLSSREFPFIHFVRQQSMLWMNDGHPPALSICRLPDAEAYDHLLLPIQVGLPQLPEAGTNLHLKILRKWVKHCDENHPRCRLPANSSLPTRLIDLGTESSTSISLYETQKIDEMKYIALSHPWGAPPHFCTFRSNIDDYKKHIDFNLLPASFQNAITISRALGCRYLWIDSICIIQGPDGDFNEEATRMEDVFSSAYCVLAASSANGQSDGFLKPREDRKFLTFLREGLPPVYICQFIDDFAQHVLEGPLNKRGWVLQERALARRTIYFTDTQTYWECGDGVRCETLTKMNNKLASFIGDPNFPEVAIKSSRGGKIRLYQDLYIQFSRLQFTRIFDRPIAIAGLEKRLIHDFECRGGFGIFDDGRGILRRSLLWHRGLDESALDRIIFPADRQLMIPSWPWMAYRGGINYLDLPFNRVDWEEQELRSPWTPDSRGYWHTGDKNGNTEITAVARDCDLIGAPEQESLLIYNIPAKSNNPDQGMKCVVVGRLQSAGQERDKMHYVLLVRQKEHQVSRGVQIYERVGVGQVLGKWINLDEPGTLVKIR